MRLCSAEGIDGPTLTAVKAHLTNIRKDMMPSDHGVELSRPKDGFHRTKTRVLLRKYPVPATAQCGPVDTTPSCTILSTLHLSTSLKVTPQASAEHSSEHLGARQTSANASRTIFGRGAPDYDQTSAP